MAMTSSTSLLRSLVYYWQRGIKRKLICLHGTAVLIDRSDKHEMNRFALLRSPITQGTGKPWHILFYPNFTIGTRMHSSRMRIVRCRCRVSQHALGRGCVSQHALGRGCLPRGGGCLTRGVSDQGGVSAQGMSLPRGLSVECMRGYMAPPMNRMTDENITLPQLRCGR